MTTSSSQNNMEDIKSRISKSLKRTFDVFNTDGSNTFDEKIQKMKISLKIEDDYSHVKNMVNDQQTLEPSKATLSTTLEPSKATLSATLEPSKATPSMTTPSMTTPSKKTLESSTALVPTNSNETTDKTTSKNQLVPFKQQQLTLLKTKQSFSKKGRKRIKPEWHPPWKLYRVLSGHLGWVRAIAVDTSNEWFVTSGNDRTIKIWDLASGTLKLTLTGHVSTVTDLAISDRHPYLFSCGEDKQVKCWDLEQNKCIRHYHGHLSAVYCLTIHPKIDILITGGRDCSARVWDIRTKQQIHLLTGHNGAVFSVASQSFEPQVITGSQDSTIRTWDLAMGKTKAILTNHKKSVRALTIHPTEYTFASGSRDNIKKWKCPEGKFMHNFSGQNTIIHSLSVNNENVLVSTGDDGSLYFWDWKSGYNFQKLQTIPQPGSLDSEKAIFCSKFDHSGSRLITGEADKSIKLWKEDLEATPETHPISDDWKQDTKRY